MSKDNYEKSRVKVDEIMLTRAKRRRLDEQNVDIVMLPSHSEVVHETRIKRVKTELGNFKVVELR